METLNPEKSCQNAAKCPIWGRTAGSLTSIGNSGKAMSSASASPLAHAEILHSV